MTDIAVSARFLRAMQPLQYEKAEAEITVSGTASSEAEVAKFMDQAQRVALAAVGKSHEFRPASPVSSREAPDAPIQSTPSGTETPAQDKAPARRGPGRPKIDKATSSPTEVPTQDGLEAALAQAAGNPEPNAADIAGVNPEPKVSDKDLPAVTDEELQTACVTAAEKITSEKIKTLYRENYRVSRVSEIEQAFRRSFLKDLKDLVVKTETAKSAKE